MVVLVVIAAWGAASVAASLAVGAVVALADRASGPAPAALPLPAGPPALLALPAPPAHLRLAEIG